MNIKSKTLKLQICDRILNEQLGPVNTTGNDSAAKAKADAKKKADATNKVNDDDEGARVTDWAQTWDYITWTGIAIGSLILLRIGKGASKELIAQAAAKRGISQTRAAFWLVNKGIGKALGNKAAKFFNVQMPAIVDGVEKNNIALETALAKTKTDNEMIKRVGVTRAEARAIIDEIGTVDWNLFAKELERKARIDYYKGTMTLDEYMIAAGYAGNPKSKAIAEKWMPIIKKAATGQMQFVKLNTISDVEKFETWFKQASSWSQRYWSKFPELNNMELYLRYSLTSKGQPMFDRGYKQEAVTYVAERINKIISNTPAISEDILNIANTTGKFPEYKKWSAIQTITKNKADVNTYLRQKFCWYAQKHSI